MPSAAGIASSAAGRCVAYTAVMAPAARARTKISLRLVMGGSRALNGTHCRQPPTGRDRFATDCSRAAPAADRRDERRVNRAAVRALDALIGMSRRAQNERK